MDEVFSKDMKVHEKYHFISNMHASGDQVYTLTICVSGFQYPTEGCILFSIEAGGLSNFD